MKTKMKFASLQKEISWKLSLDWKHPLLWREMDLKSGWYPTNTGVICLMGHIVELLKYFSILSYLNGNFFLKLGILSCECHHSWRKGKMLSHDYDLTFWITIKNYKMKEKSQCRFTRMFNERLLCVIAYR